MFRQKIRKAMRLLDKKAPGWRAKVPTDRRLDMAIGEPERGAPKNCGCVLFHTFGNYTKGLRALGLEFDNGRWDYAFSVWGCGRLHDFDTLTAEWREELQRVPSAK